MACRVGYRCFQGKSLSELMGPGTPAEPLSEDHPDYIPDDLLCEPDCSDEYLEQEVEQVHENYDHAKRIFSYRLFRYEKTLRNRNPRQALDRLMQEVEDYDFEWGESYALRGVEIIFLRKIAHILQKSIATLLLIARQLTAQLGLCFTCAQVFTKWFGALPKGAHSTGALLRQTPWSPLAPPV